MPVVLLAVLAAILVLPAPAQGRPRWVWPVGGAVVGHFRLAADRFAAHQRRGIDIAVPPGTTVRAACPGRVTFAGTLPRGGRAVTVACGALNATYLHLGLLRVRSGGWLAPGRPLGTVGIGGRLRLGARVRIRRFGYVDPLTLLADPRGVDPPAVALPRVGLPSTGPGRAPESSPSPRRVAAPLASPARTGAPAAAPGLPFAGAWLPTGFGSLIAAFALESLRRLRASRRAPPPRAPLPARRQVRA
jgi:hypothetical protein